MSSGVPLRLYLTAHTVFGLKLKGERALFTHKDGLTIVDSVRFLGSVEGVSYGRWVCHTCVHAGAVTQPQVLPSGVDKHPFMRHISFGAQNTYPKDGTVVISGVPPPPPPSIYCLPICITVGIMIGISVLPRLCIPVSLCLQLNWRRSTLCQPREATSLLNLPT